MLQSLLTSISNYVTRTLVLGMDRTVALGWGFLLPGFITFLSYGAKKNKKELTERPWPIQVLIPYLIQAQKW